MLPEASTEELIAAAVARAPHKHSAVPEARMARALRGVIDAGTDNWLETYESRVREIGGDPMELLPGNRPRYTMGDDLDVKDHVTGLTHVMAPHTITLGDIERIRTEGPEAVLGPPDYVECGADHVWPEAVDSDSRCIHCGLTFKAWAES